ncbi:MAG TPA: hypothetical protein VF516_32420 [Kofleriaceae bacterium]
MLGTLDLQGVPSLPASYLIQVGGGVTIAGTGKVTRVDTRMPTPAATSS